MRERRLRTVLVTGAGGYLGSVLVPRLLQAGFAVRAYDRFFFGTHRLAPHERLELIEADTRRLERQHLAGVEAIVDLAAISNDPSGEAFAAATWAINHAARARCAGLAKAMGVARYLLPSSCSVYGFRPPDQVCDEATPAQPLTTYARANLAAERDVLALADTGFCVTVLRLATLYGPSPRMRFDLAVNGMTAGALATGRLPLMRDGSQWRPLLHVVDAASAFQLMLEAPAREVAGEIFNVGEANLRLADLAARVAQALPRPVTIDWYGDPDTRSYRVDLAKLARLGWQPHHDHRGGRARDRGRTGRGHACPHAGHDHVGLVQGAGEPLCERDGRRRRFRAPLTLRSRATALSP